MKRLLALAAGMAVLTAAFAGAQHVADGAAQAAVTRLESALPPGRAFTYASVSADMFSSGATLRDVRYTLADGTEISADTVEIGSVSGAEGAEVADRLVARGLTVVPAGQEMPVQVLVGRLEARDLAAEPLTGMLAGGPAAWPQFSGISLEDMVLSDSRDVFMTIARGEIGRGAFGYVGRSTLSDIRLPIGTSPEAPDRIDLVTIAGAEVSEFNLAPMLELPDEPTAAQVSAAIAATGDSTMRVDEIIGSRNGEPLLTIVSIVGETDNGEDGVSRQSLRAGDIFFARGVFVNNQGGNLIEELGYDGLHGELTVDLAFDAPAQELDFTSIRLGLREAVSLDIGMNFGAVPLRLLNPGYEPSEEELSKLTFQGISLTLQDDSLLHRVATMVGSKQGLDGEIYRQAQAASLRQTAANAEIPAVRDFFNELANFVETPGTLDVKARPVQPIPLVALVATAMTDPFVALSLLEVEVASR